MGINIATQKLASFSFVSAEEIVIVRRQEEKMKILIFILRTLKTLLEINKARKLYGFLAKSFLHYNQIGHFKPLIIYSKDEVTTTLKVIEFVPDSAKIAYNLELLMGMNNNSLKSMAYRYVFSQ